MDVHDLGGSGASIPSSSGAACPLLLALATEPDPSPPQLPWLEELQEAHFRGILHRLRQSGIRAELIPSSHGEILRASALARIVKVGIS